MKEQEQEQEAREQAAAMAEAEENRRVEVYMRRDYGPFWDHPERPRDAGRDWTPTQDEKSNVPVDSCAQSRLFAAAPELLDACQCAASHIRLAIGEQPGGNWGLLLTQIQQAIAKANTLA